MPTHFHRGHLLINLLRTISASQTALSRDDLKIKLHVFHFQVVILATCIMWQQISSSCSLFLRHTLLTAQSALSNSLTQLFLSGFFPMTVFLFIHFKSTFQPFFLRCVVDKEGCKDQINPHDRSVCFLFQADNQIILPHFKNKFYSAIVRSYLSLTDCAHNFRWWVQVFVATVAGAEDVSLPARVCCKLVNSFAAIN